MHDHLYRHLFIYLSLEMALLSIDSKADPFFTFFFASFCLYIVDSKGNHIVEYQHAVGVNGEMGIESEFRLILVSSIMHVDVMRHSLLFFFAISIFSSSLSFSTLLYSNVHCRPWQKNSSQKEHQTSRAKH